MAYFPFFVEIKNKQCVVFGGGKVALRKIEKLLPFGCNITAVSPKFHEAISKLNNINLVYDEFNPHYLAGAFFVIAATDDMQVNSQISALCREKGISVNVVDVKEECSFIFPALYQNGDICVGISTGGKSPQAAKAIRKSLDETIPPYMGNAVEALGQLREKIKTEIPSQKAREKAFAMLYKAICENSGSISREEIESIIKTSLRLCENNEN